MSSFSALNVDLVFSRTKGSAHPNGHVASGNKDSNAKENSQASLHNMDVLYSPAAGRVQRILSVELSVNLSDKLSKYSSAMQGTSSMNASDAQAAYQSYSTKETNDDDEKVGKIDVDSILAGTSEFIGGAINDVFDQEGDVEEQDLQIAKQVKQGLMEAFDNAKSAIEKLDEYNDKMEKTLDFIKQAVETQANQLLGTQTETSQDDADAVQEDSVEKTLEAAKDLIMAKSSIGQVPQNFAKEEALNEVQPQFMANPSYRSYQSRFSISSKSDITLQIKTNDGDLVTLVAQQGSRYQSRTSFSQLSGDGQDQMRFKQTSEYLGYSNFTYQVEGDLDADELKALDSLFQQVNELADHFYSGNLGAAVDAAMAFKLDASELSSMNLTMTSQTAVKMREAYQQQAPRMNMAKPTPLTGMSGGIEGGLLSYLEKAKAQADLLDQIPALPDLGSQLNKLLPEAIVQHPQNQPASQPDSQFIGAA